jgi:pSer/pThr/pTyr-binding forkhead associated (FHA) protein
MVYHDEASTRVVDDRSLKGVFVNGKRVELAELRSGDVLTIGAFELLLVTVSGSPPSESGVQDPAPAADRSGVTEAPRHRPPNTEQAPQGSERPKPLA